MALIPADVGIRMRMQTEASLTHPIAPVHEIPSDLPDLRPGQRFAARIQEVLPDNSYKALVAGKQLTLQLPEGAKTGDEMELVVLDRSSKVIIARQVAPQPATQNPNEPVPYEFAKFSPAARMISQLLPAQGDAAPPVTLNKGQPLLAQPPQSHNAAVLLAPTLAKAVTQSGLFYEAHQAQWATGQRPLADLLAEPQGQHSTPAALSLAAADTVARPAATERVTTSTILQALQTAPTKVGTGETAPNASPTAPAATSTTQAATTPIAEELRPLVQQQLDTLATQRMHWHGEIWPQQTLDWQIQRDLEREADGSLPDESRWSTTLALTTPRLGRIDAALHLSSTGIRIVLATPYGASAADLRDEAPKLAGALAAAGIPLTGFQVRHEKIES